MVSRIWHRLGHDDIEMLTQQYVQRPEGYALTDVYFPQFGMHVEVMEDAHRNYIAADEARLKDIVNITNHRVEQVWPGDSQNASSSLKNLHDRIDEIVSALQHERKLMIAAGTWEEWDDPDYPYSVERWRKAGRVSLENGAAFRFIRDVCYAFGNPNPPVRSAWARNHLDEKTRLWFPKLTSNADWENLLLEDGLFIKERCLSTDPTEREGHYRSCMRRKHIHRITFARGESALGVTLYRFVGVFEMIPEQSDPDGTVLYRRISDFALTLPWGQPLA